MCPDGIDSFHLFLWTIVETIDTLNILEQTATLRQVGFVCDICHAFSVCFRTNDDGFAKWRFEDKYGNNTPASKKYFNYVLKTLTPLTLFQTIIQNKQ